MFFARYATLRADLRAPRNWRRFAVVAALAMIIAVGVTIAWRLLPPVQFTLRDMHAVANALGGVPPVYTGWLVYVGVLGWFAATAAAFLLALLARRVPGRGELTAFGFGFAALTLLLGVDDLFLLHDGILPVLGVRESTYLLALTLLAVAWGLVFLPMLLRDPDMPIFALAVALFAWAMLADQLEGASVLDLLNEEAAKLAAVFLWTVWIFSVALRELTLRGTAAESREHVALSA